MILRTTRVSKATSVSNEVPGGLVGLGNAFISDPRRPILGIGNGHPPRAIVRLSPTCCGFGEDPNRTDMSRAILHVS